MRETEKLEIIIDEEFVAELVALGSSEKMLDFLSNSEEAECPDELKAAAAQIFQDKSEEEILQYLKGVKYEWSLVEVGINMIDMASKSEEEVMKIMVDSEYDFYICEACVKFLKLPENIIFISRNDDGDDVLMQAATDALKISQKPEAEAIRIFNLCDKDSDDEIKRHIAGCISFEDKSDDEIIAILEAVEYDSHVCWYALPFLFRDKDESYILEFLKKLPDEREISNYHI